MKTIILFFILFLTWAATVGADTIEYEDCKTGEKIDESEIEGKIYRVLTYDDKGRLISAALYEGDRQSHDISGTHKVEYHYNDKGDLIIEKLIPPDLEYIKRPAPFTEEEIGGVVPAPPVENENDYYGTMYKYYYDQSGNRITTKVFDLNGKPKEGFVDVHETVYTYNEYGQLINISYFDINGNPTMDQQGIHEEIFEYDIEGNVISRSKYEKNGVPQDSFYGVQRVEYLYDALGILYLIKYYDITGERIEIDYQ